MLWDINNKIPYNTMTIQALLSDENILFCTDPFWCTSIYRLAVLLNSTQWDTYIYLSYIPTMVISSSMCTELGSVSGHRMNSTRSTVIQAGCDSYRACASSEWRRMAYAHAFKWCKIFDVVCYCRTYMRLACNQSQLRFICIYDNCSVDIQIKRWMIFIYADFILHTVLCIASRHVILGRRVQTLHSHWEAAMVGQIRW